uniref:Acetyl-coenzyme A carboxylase carboxyl transferase subunit beta, chloroplastic n=1 Tax=Medicago papillosa TaxID=70964 RepID=A0A0F6NLQ5_9FABA|nr:acetyl-CoA carboxylase carboxyltransferase beta subunit [Medicago papillosa]AIL56220.1 acetyl-CoA carboxylase carboxyltransferase beta subunit [Medicago papillosa]
MEKWWFNSMMFNRGLEYRCGLSKSIDSFGPIENNSVNEDPSILTDMDNTIHSDYDYLVDVRVGKTIVRILVIAMNIRNFLSDKTFLVRDSNSYSIYNWNNIINSCIEGYLRSEIGIDNSIFDDSNDSDSDNDSDKYNDSDWDNDSGNDSDDYDKLQKASYILEPENDSDTDSDTDSGNDSGNDSDKVQNSSEIESTSIITITKDTNDFSHLWVACDNCYGNNYKRFFKSKMNICEYCGCHLKMSSSDRIELLIDPGTWNPMDEDMVSVDPIEFNSEDEPSENSLDSSENDSYQNSSYQNSSEDEPSENSLDSSENDSYPNSSEDELSENSSEDEPSENSSEDELSENSSEDEPSENDDYQNRLDSYQDRTGLLEAVQTGTGQVNGIPVAIGIMDFQFMGGSMGSVVGEKITRLIEYATNQRLPLIIVCASGGARMQEGSLSLMQMAKISSALYNYQINQKLFYVPILTSPTTGGVTASFGMLGDIIIAEPDAYIAFAGKRVIEQTLNIEVPEGSQSAEFLFEKGLFDSIVPRNSLKEVLSELLHFHGFFPLTQTEK